MNIEYIESGGGAFEVIVDGRLVYSKKETGEFPDPMDIVAEVRRHCQE